MLSTEGAAIDPFGNRLGFTWRPLGSGWGVGQGGHTTSELEVLSARCRPQMRVIGLLVLLSVDKDAAAAKSLVMRSGHLSQLLWDGGGPVLTPHLALLSPPAVSDPKSQLEGGEGASGPLPTLQGANSAQGCLP